MTVRIHTLGAQGDVLFRRVDALPTEGLKREDSLVVAHSETGHHHRARVQADFELERYTTPDPLVSYLHIRRRGDALREVADAATRAIDAVLIEHERTFDTHETHALVCEDEEATYQVIRQRQLTPEGWVRAVVD